MAIFLEDMNMGKDIFMKTCWTYLMSVVIMLIFSGCKSTPLTSSRLTSSLSVEATLGGWPPASPVYLADSSITVQAANDNMNLYLAVQSDDPEYRIDLQRTGLTVWVDEKGGRSKQVEIHFPAAYFARFNRIRGGFWQSLSDSEKVRASQKLDQLEGGVLVINHQNDQYRNFPANSPTGFAAAISVPARLETIVMRIPLQFEKEFLTLKLPPKQKTVGIGLATGGVTGGVSSGRRGFSRGGFRRGSVPAGGSLETKEFWLEVSLAK
jgi:hypothetical protein